MDVGPAPLAGLAAAAPESVVPPQDSIAGAGRSAVLERSIGGVLIRRQAVNLAVVPAVAVASRSQENGGPGHVVGRLVPARLVNAYDNAASNLSRDAPCSGRWNAD